MKIAGEIKEGEVAGNFVSHIKSPRGTTSNFNLIGIIETQSLKQ